MSKDGSMQHATNAWEEGSFVKEINDDEEAGNEQGQREDYSNLGVKEVVHPSMPFQCEDCWMYHL